MALTILAVKRLGALRASDAQSEEALRSIPDGEVVTLKITRTSKRSIQHHRLFFALLNIVGGQLDWTTDQMLVWTKIATGHCDVVFDRRNQATFVPKSISFAKMNQAEFDEFFRHATTAILDRLLPPGTPRSDLMEEVSERAGLTRKVA